MDEVFPALAAHLRELLTADGQGDLAAQVPNLVIRSWCSCGDDFCQTFTTVPTPWPEDAGTLSYDTPYGMLNVDAAPGRILGIEALFYPPLT